MGNDTLQYASKSELRRLSHQAPEKLSAEIIRLERDRAELMAALEIARSYVHQTHAVIAAANHKDESPCKPDLQFIDSVLSRVRGE